MIFLRLVRLAGLPGMPERTGLTEHLALLRSVAGLGRKVAVQQECCGSQLSTSLCTGWCLWKRRTANSRL
ncbi:hypothetical protein WJX79_006145 [Trebouxia sp. C0005]